MKRFIHINAKKKSYITPFTVFVSSVNLPLKPKFGFSFSAGGSSDSFFTLSSGFPHSWFSPSESLFENFLRLLRIGSHESFRSGRSASGRKSDGLFKLLLRLNGLLSRTGDLSWTGDLSRGGGDRTLSLLNGLGRLSRSFECTRFPSRVSVSRLNGRLRSFGCEFRSKFGRRRSSVRLSSPYLSLRLSSPYLELFRGELFLRPTSSGRLNRSELLSTMEQIDILFISYRSMKSYSLWWKNIMDWNTNLDVYLFLVHDLLDANRDFHHVVGHPFFHDSLIRLVFCHFEYDLDDRAVVKIVCCLFRDNCRVLFPEQVDVVQIFLFPRFYGRIVHLVVCSKWRATEWKLIKMKSSSSATIEYMIFSGPICLLVKWYNSEMANAFPFQTQPVEHSNRFTGFNPVMVRIKVAGLTYVYI